MRTYKLHMIRHGLTEANTDGRYIGVTDVPLSAVGIDWLQSQRKEGFYPAADIVFSSPLARCTETVGIIYPDKEPYLIDELREYNFGEFENKTADELDGTDNYMDWISGKIPSPPGGEDPTAKNPPCSPMAAGGMTLPMEQGFRCRYRINSEVPGPTGSTFRCSCPAPRRPCRGKRPACR